MENFLFTFTQKNPSEFLVEQRAKDNEQRAKTNEQRAKSNEQRAKSSAFKIVNLFETVFDVSCFLHEFVYVFRKPF